VGHGVALPLPDTRDAALAAPRKGVVRLIAFELGDTLARTLKAAPALSGIALSLRGVAAADALRDDLERAIADRAFIGDDPLPRHRDAYVAQIKRARARLPAVVEGMLRVTAAIATAHHALSQRIAALPASQRRLAAVAKTQRDGLVHPGFLAATPWTQLAHLPRFLEALSRRLERHSQNPERDARHAAQIAAGWTRWQERVEQARRDGTSSPGLEEFRWLIEELRVSLFAQELRTSVPVSLKRIDRAWNDLLRRG
jgi:ATP-dependent helicase HrpA